LLKKLGKEREGSRYDEYEPYVGEKAMLIHRQIITAKGTKSEGPAQGVNTLLGPAYGGNPTSRNWRQIRKISRASFTPCGTSFGFSILRLVSGQFLVETTISAPICVFAT